MTNRLRKGSARLAGPLILAISLLAPSQPTDAQATATFSRIDVAGTQRIDPETVRVFAGLEAGVPLTPEEINLAVRRLFASGLFESVEIVPEAGRLVITVVENPTINRIAFEGNRSLDDETLTTAIELRPRLAYSVAAAEADAQRILDAYRAAGRFAARVEPVIIRQPDNRVDLVFEITEGRVTPIQRIAFVGNQVFSDTRLRRAIQTGQANLWTSIFGGLTYDADRLELDRELLRQFYLERGYIDFRVVSSTAELAPERNAFFVTFTVSEGERYDFGTPSVVSSVPGLNAADFAPLLNEIRPGRVYNAVQVERVIERMAFQAGQQGFAFVEIVPRIQRDDANRRVDITFELQEGERVFIERIDIVGNTRTLDRVIRRQFRVVEGDAFNAREVRAAEDRIRGLGYFANTQVSVREGAAPASAIVRVEVEEQPTGSLNLGGAFSTNEGLAAQISITERNFLGRGQTVSAAFSGSSQFQNLEFGFAEPALLDRDLLAGFSLYYRDRNFDEQSFQTRNVGFEPRIGFPTSENGRLTVRYRLSEDEISDVVANTSQIIRDEEGKAITSSMAFTYAFDRRNSVVDPTAGFILSMSQEFAGIGGDTQFSKTQGTARAFTSLFDEDLVFAATLEGGAQFWDGNSRVTERFSTGGDSFRGFARNGIGPRDRCGPGLDLPDCVRGPENVSVDEPLGGNYFAVARLDASFPIGFPQEYGIFGGVFADAGSVWGLDNTAGSMGEVDDSFYVRSSVGVSVIFETAFAPLRFNYAWPLRSRPGDEEEQFRFTIQTRF
jgi:outer membrane protein insertion porin family